MFNELQRTLPNFLKLLEPRKIHLWHFNHTLLPINQNLLSKDEKARAEQFHFAKDSAAFICSRATLRSILAQYTNIDPCEIRFHYTPYGKPFLDPLQNPHHLHFNVSHSHQAIIYAISQGYEVGVDIEYMNHTIDYLSIAKNFFSPYEYDYLNKTDKAQQSTLFYRILTCKEAFIKAIGLGLSYSLTDFDVGDFSNQSAKILRMKDDKNARKAWSLFYYTPLENYSAAIATRQTMPTVLDVSHVIHSP